MQFVDGLIQGLGTHDATTTILGYPTFSHTLCPQWACHFPHWHYHLGYTDTPISLRVVSSLPDPNTS